MYFENGLRVCIGNYGYYNEGELHDAWLTLPKSDEEIFDFLKANRLWDPMHEEIYISDYDGIPFGLERLFGECCHLDDLNVLAAQLMELNETDYERLECWFDHADQPDSLIGLMNIIEQADELPVYTYDYDGAWSKNMWGNYTVDECSPLENLGYQMLEWNTELRRVLEADSLAMSAFDVEEYGRQHQQLGWHASDHCCADGNDGGPNPGWYSLAELKELHPIEGCEAEAA